MMSNLFQKLKYSNHHSSSQPTISNVSSNINSNENNFSNNSRYVSKSEADKIGLYSPTHLDTTTLEAMTHLENIILFDPGPVLEEAEGLNEISFLDDRSFVIDDNDEYSQLSIQLKLDGILKDNNYYVVNEIPESRPSKLMNSSRPSSRNSSASGFTSTNMSEHQIDIYLNSNRLPSLAQEEYRTIESASIYDNEASKNALLDALTKKFNLSIQNIDAMPRDIGDLFYSKRDDETHKIEEEIQYIDGKEIRFRKENIFLSSLITANPPTTSNISTISTSRSTYAYDPVVTTSSYSGVPEIKKDETIQLPQTFECRYMGKSRCRGLWGKKNIREPIDRLVRNAKRLRSVSELPKVKAIMSEKGIHVEYITNFQYHNYKEKTPRNGIVPIANISYAAQDNVYGKIFACIVVKEKDQKTISECYAFLCSTNEMCRRMALAITGAFQKYASYLNSISNYQQFNKSTSSRLYTRDDSGNFRDSYA